MAGAKVITPTAGLVPYCARRWPVEPLHALIGPPPPRRTRQGPPAARHVWLASQVGVSASTAQKWETSGLTDRQADNAAVALGRHPAELWGWAEWADVLTEA